MKQPFSPNASHGPSPDDVAPPPRAERPAPDAPRRTLRAAGRRGRLQEAALHGARCADRAPGQGLGAGGEELLGTRGRTQSPEESEWGRVWCVLFGVQWRWCLMFIFMFLLVGAGCVVGVGV